jgi:outer membrane immunogenic protein
MKLKMLKALLIATSALAISIPTIASAGADSGFYIGGGVGESDASETDTAYKAFGGFNFGVIPLIDLAVEASYVDMGTAADITAINAFGLGGLSFGPFGVFVKAGVAEVDSKLGGSETEAVYGAGARFQFGSLAVRVEYEEYDVPGNLSMTSVSGVWTF